MKNLIKLASVLFLMLTFTNSSYSQVGSTCRNIVKIYPGPRNTTELVVLLNTSTNSTIAALTCSTKTSLETYMVFNNGVPFEMSGADTCITRIYADSLYCSNLFTAIFGVQDIVCTFATKPNVTNITLAEFIA
jgi:hypothetical protein